jgi:hypothetical protein
MVYFAEIFITLFYACAIWFGIAICFYALISIYQLSKIIFKKLKFYSFYALKTICRCCTRIFNRFKSCKFKSSKKNKHKIIPKIYDETYIVIINPHNITLGKGYI